MDICIQETNCKSQKAFTSHKSLLFTMQGLFLREYISEREGIFLEENYVLCYNCQY